MVHGGGDPDQCGVAMVALVPAGLGYCPTQGHGQLHGHTGARMGHSLVGAEHGGSMLGWGGPYVLFLRLGDKETWPQ